jgi:hypothetical protein
MTRQPEKKEDRQKPEKVTGKLQTVRNDKA